MIDGLGKLWSLMIYSMIKIVIIRVTFQIHLAKKEVKIMENERTLQERISRFINAGFPILQINSYEEDIIDKTISEAVNTKKEILEWNGVNGFSNFYSKKSYNIEDPSLAGTLKFLAIDKELDGRILVIKDASSVLKNPEIVALLKNIAGRINKGNLDANVIIVSSVSVLPEELEPYITILEMNYLTIEEIEHIILEFIDEYQIDSVPRELIEEMAISFKGLTNFEIVNILSLAYTEGATIKKEDVALINEQKRQMILKSGILDMVPLKEGESINDIGGLDNLKEWLGKKAKIFKNIEKAKQFVVDIPKGVLIAGVPGCGKSLNAKAAAKLFEVPLLRLDMGRIMGKYVGESEANMRKAINLAEAIAPCVVWIDELEKGLAGVGGEGGGADVTTRLFGSLLTWMQEKESAAFVVATANDIVKLPPELLRKGRFDEIFYVGLPNDTERKRIFEIHIAKRRKEDLKDIDLDSLVSRTDGYSGADIEGVVKQSIENVYTEGKEKLTTDDIIEAIKNTHSLSEIMKEPLKKMSEEYKNRKFKNASR